jgi:glycosyltransferase involved in cell wall biosynthesis
VKPASWNLPTGLAIVPGGGRWPCEFSDWQVSVLREHGTVSDVLRVGLSGWPRSLAALACMWKALTYRGPRRDSILAYFAWPCGYVGLVLAWRWRARLVIYEHTSPAEHVTRWPLGMASLRQASLVISPSQAHADALSQVCGRSVNVVPNAINTADADGGIVFVGRFVMQKGVDVLIEVARRMPEHVFHFIGSGPLEPWLRARALDNVRFHAPMDHASVLRWLASADAVVIPSRHESFGLICAEACDLGAMVIATDVGIHSAVGGVIYSGGANELAQAIRDHVPAGRRVYPDHSRFSGAVRAALHHLTEEPCSLVAG